jgi:hypothetical protein
MTSFLVKRNHFSSNTRTFRKIIFLFPCTFPNLCKTYAIIVVWAVVCNPCPTPWKAYGNDRSEYCSLRLLPTPWSSETTVPTAVKPTTVWIAQTTGIEPLCEPLSLAQRYPQRYPTGLQPLFMHSGTHITIYVSSFLQFFMVFKPSSNTISNFQTYPMFP